MNKPQKTVDKLEKCVKMGMCAGRSGADSVSNADMFRTGLSVIIRK